VTGKQSLRYNRDYFPNVISLPPSVWTKLQVPAVIGTDAGIAQSVMEYVQKQIKTRLQIDVQFVELPYLDKDAKTTNGFFVEADGANSTGRIVIHRKDAKAIKMPIAMPLTGGALLPSPTEGGVRKNYLAFAGPLAIVYPETIGYIDAPAAV